ncbi:MAG TPA: diguanylate cyclase [Burkholderiales bacterium]
MPQSTAQSTEVPQRCVLVVDDSRFVRTTFATILRPSFAVREEVDGEAGWLAIESDPSIVMVLTDLDMPKLTGFGLIGRIRASADARIRELPVVVISGNEEPGSKERAREAGATDFISKSAEATEVLSRLHNVLRLVATSKELQSTKQALDESSTHDSLTGTFTAHYLMTEGRKHYAHARRHGGQLSVMALRIDSYADVVRAAGKEVADVVVKRIAKLLMDKVRTEDSVARTAQAAFMVVAAGTAAPQMLVLAQRLQRELGEAKVSYRGTALRFVTSFGVASLSLDAVNSIEELTQVAMQRLQSASSLKLEPEPSAPQRLPSEIERALQVLEKADAAHLGAGAKQVLKRLQRIAKKLH